MAQEQKENPPKAQRDKNGKEDMFRKISCQTAAGNPKDEDAAIRSFPKFIFHRGPVL